MFIIRGIISFGANAGGLKMDNRSIDIQDDGRLEKWLSCAIGSRSVVGWSEGENDNGVEFGGKFGIPKKVYKRKRLILYWTEPHYKVNNKEKRGGGFTKFPHELKVPELTPVIQIWLDHADYGPQPDHDGDNGKGFRIYNESWGHIAEMWEAFLAIQPCWAMYGK